MTADNVFFCAELADAFLSAGMEYPNQGMPLGKVIRFSTNGKPHDTAGWCLAFVDGKGAAFGCNRDGSKFIWQQRDSNAPSPTEFQRQAARAKAELARQQAARERAVEHAAAAEQAAILWRDACALEPKHPYVTRKKITPYVARQDEAGNIVLPIYSANGALVSLQFIGADGGKRFLKNGKMKGGRLCLGVPKNGKPLTLDEGWATGSSLHEATGDVVVIAFSGYNMAQVAADLRRQYPQSPLTIAADLDASGKGLEYAEAAAVEGAPANVVTPAFPDGRDSGDFNDLHQLAGAEAVRCCINAARTVMVDPMAEAWSMPVPLPDALPPVQPFDAELLPAALRDWVMDIANRMQCPPDFPAVGAVVSVSSVIGARAVVQPKARDDWLVVPNLWGLIVGRPGVMKSPALAEVTKPLRRLQATESERWQTAHDTWEIDAKLDEMLVANKESKAKGLVGKDLAAARALLEPVADPNDEPAMRRYVINDATVEKLGVLLQKNPWGTLAYRDELYGLLTALDKPGQEGSRTFYLQSYDGNQSYTFDRIMRGTIHIDRICLSMLGGIQPGRVQEYVRGAVSGGSADDGLLQRFSLTVWPDVNGEFHHIDQWPDTVAKQAAWEVFERLAALQPDGDAEPQVWRFDEAAQALFVEWRIPFEQELKHGDLHPAMESHLAKYRKLIPALALVFALIDTPDSGGVIAEKELNRALVWGDYLRSHANRLYSAAMMPDTAGAALLLKKIKAGALGSEFTPRLVVQKGWSGLSTADVVRKAANVLVDYDWLRRDVQQSSDAMGRGRPSVRYLVNPEALP